MRIITLILDGEQPISWNKMYSGLHWSKRKAEVDRVHLAVRVALDPDEPIFDKLVAITVRVYFKNKRVQFDNANIPAKIYEDGLIGWLIEDDKPQYVRSMTTVSLLDRQNPRVEIEIKEFAEIVRREREVKAPPPKPLPNPDFGPIIKLGQNYIDELAETGYADEDYDHWMFETAMNAVFGPDVWEWTNPILGGE